MEPHSHPECQALIRHIRSSDPNDNLPWLVLADWLDERSDPRAYPVRWWRYHRPGIIAAAKWDADPVYWLGEVSAVVNRWQAGIGEWWRMYTVECGRMVASRYPVPEKVARVINGIWLTAELYVLGLATVKDLEVAESAARTERGRGIRWWGSRVTQERAISFAETAAESSRVQVPRLGNAARAARAAARAADSQKQQQSARAAAFTLFASFQSLAFPEVVR